MEALSHLHLALAADIASSPAGNLEQLLTVCVDYELQVRGCHAPTTPSRH
jgi:hypothetical protein